MKRLVSMLACGLFAAALSLTGCIGYYERVVEPEVLVPMPPSPSMVTVKKGTSKIPEMPAESCIFSGGHRVCIPLEKKPEHAQELQTGTVSPPLCATPGKWEPHGAQWVCKQPAPKSRFVPSTSSFSCMTQAYSYYPYGYPFWGGPFMTGPFWGGTLYGAPSVFYVDPQKGSRGRNSPACQ